MGNPVLFLFLYLLFVLYLIVMSVARRDKVSRAVYVTLLLIFFVLPWGRELSVYYPLCRRAGQIVRELPAGFPADKIPRYLEHNKERLQISGWRYHDARRYRSYIVSLDSPTCVLRTLVGRGDLLIVLDPTGKTVQRVDWVE